jgi:hypothetical protein
MSESNLPYCLDDRKRIKRLLRIARAKIPVQ